MPEYKEYKFSFTLECTANGSKLAIKIVHEALTVYNLAFENLKKVEITNLTKTEIEALNGD